MKIYSLDTGYFKLDGGAMFGVVPKTIWNKLNPADENNLCDWAMRCLLVVTGDRRILIDTGIGNKQDAKFFGHYFLHGNGSLMSSITQLGFTPDDITDVFLTHLHFDHVGGAIVNEGGSPATAFPNASYWSNEQHWKWATEPNAREKASFLKENILPLYESGQLKFVHSPSFSDGIEIRFVHGHTESMMLPQIRYKDRTVVFMADLLPSAAHIPLPYVMAYDMFPLTTIEEKKIFLEEAVENNYVLFFEHDPRIECCDLERTDKGIRVKNTFRLADI